MWRTRIGDDGRVWGHLDGGDDGSWEVVSSSKGGLILLIVIGLE